MRLTVLLFLFILGGAIHAEAQKLKQHGDLTFLKGQEKVNVVFNYDNMVVGKKSEAEYVAEKMAEKEKEEGLGAGEKWHEMWLADRSKFYEPKFLELINKTSKGAEFGSFPDAQYTLEFKVTRFEPGWNIGLTKMPAQIDAVANFVESSAGEPLAHVTIDKAPGSQAMGYDFDVAARVKESFAISGKRLGALLNKKAFK